MIPHEWLEQAAVRIAAHLRTTPLTEDVERRLFIKWENRQVTGSFKPRGALNKILGLEDWERAAGLVAVSAGNHGQGVAMAAGLTGAKAQVFVPEHAVEAKVQAIRELGAEVRRVPGGYAEAEEAGRAYAAENQKNWVSPYNDGQVIAGQGTLGLEILRILGGREAGAAWLVPIGGGGLIAGLGAALSGTSPRPRLIGIQSEASPFTHSLFKRGTQSGVDDLPTLADGLSGAVEKDSITIPLMREFVDDILLVSEDDIARAIAFAWYVFGEKIEGSGAVGLAAILTRRVQARPAVAVVSGGNIQPEVHARIVAKYQGEKWN